MQNRNIYIAASPKEEAAGWAFIDETNNYIRCCGCRRANVQTAWAMALLQALFYVKEIGGNYSIYGDGNWRNCNGLTERIRALDSSPEILIPENLVVFQQAQEAAEQTAIKILNDKRMIFDDVEPGQNLIQRQDLFSQNYLALAVFHASKTVALKNLSSKGKAITPWGREQFDAGDFISL